MRHRPVNSWSFIIYSTIALQLLSSFVCADNASANIPASAPNTTSPLAGLHVAGNQSSHVQPLPGSAPTSANPSTRASVFSTILALCLCCFTQPYGSLLFPDGGGWYWRLSPISAILEAILIFYCLWLGRDQEATASVRVHAESLLGAIKSTLNRNARASNKDEEVAIDSVLGGASSSKDRARSESAHNAPVMPKDAVEDEAVTHEPMQAPVAGGDDSLQHLRRIQTDMGNPPRSAWIDQSRKVATVDGSQIAHVPRPVIAPESHQTPIIFQSTSMDHATLLSKKGTGLHGLRSTAGALLLLRTCRYRHLHRYTSENIRSELVGYKTRRVQIWTSISMAFLFAKLLVVRGAPIFQAMGLCFVFSWLSVEVLILLVYWHDFTEAQLHTVCQESAPIEKSVVGTSWRISWAIATLLLIESLLIFIVSRNPSVFLIVCNAITTAVFEGCLLIMVYRVPNRYAAGFFIYISSAIGYVWWASTLNYKPRSDHETVGNIIKWALGCIYLVLGAIIVGAMLWLIVDAGPTNRTLKKLPSFYNLSVFVGLGTVYILHYNQEGTYKPGWLEWIGM